MDFGFQKKFFDIVKSHIEKSDFCNNDLDKLYEKLPDYISEITKSSAEIIFNSIENSLYKNIFYNRLLRDEFLIHQEQKWGEALIYYETLYFCCVECGAELYKYMTENQKLTDKSYMFDVLMNIHARMCTICGEILCLMRNGYADGAFARWRTMDELKTIMFFIKQYGNDVAKSYYEYMEFEDFKYNKKYSNIIDMNNYEMVSEKYRFYENKSDYEWARSASCFIKNKNRITYKMIFDETGLNKEFQEEYDLACKTIHASPSATFNRLSSTGKDYEPLIAGPTDFGFPTPGQNAALSIMQGTICFILLEPTIDSQISAQLLILLSEKTIDAFEKAEKTYLEILNK